MLQKDNFHVKDLYVSTLLLSAVLLRKYNAGMNSTTVTADNYIYMSQESRKHVQIIGFVICAM